MQNRYNFLLVPIFLLIYSCNLSNKEAAVNSEKDKQDMLNADSKFSNLSGTKGMKNAYLEFIDSNGVLLRPNVYPLLGADAVDYIIAQKDEGFEMSWKAKDGVVANSGELGYTYGTYKVHLQNPDTTFTGTYVTIWKKQTDGKWKFVLDANNEGLGEEPASQIIQQ
jgi:ketosteroid isomerase-like protein